MISEAARNRAGEKRIAAEGARDAVQKREPVRRGVGPRAHRLVHLAASVNVLQGFGVVGAGLSPEGF
jgi:hypothetical protein